MDCDDDELKNAREYEDHADEHPDVQEGDVGDTRYILPHLNEKVIILVSFLKSEQGKKLSRDHVDKHPHVKWGDVGNPSFVLPAVCLTASHSQIHKKLPSDKGKIWGQIGIFC